MIIFDLGKEKIFRVEADIQGIDTSKLNFYFRLDVNGIEYGFQGKFTDGTITIDIPMLGSIIDQVSIINGGKYNARLEAFCDLENGSGYYNSLWVGHVTLKITPSIKAKVNELSETKDNIIPKTKIGSIEDEDVTINMDEQTINTNTNELQEEIHVAKKSKLFSIFH